MGWVRLDDGFPRNPKVAPLPLDAKWAYVEALCYAAEFETDGFVPDVIAVNGPVRETLVSQGLWDIADGGVTIHDFLEYNPTREQKQSIRDSRRLAGAIGAATRYGDSKGVGVGGLEVREKESFDLLWETWPRKVGKRAAETAFRRALKRGVPVTAILAGAERLRDDPNLPPKQFIPHLSTWLNGDRWNDEPFPARESRGKPDAAAAALRKTGRWPK